jgi:hypothetical protein
MHALALCASLHWQTANSAPKIKETLPARSRKSHAHDLKNQPNNTRKKSAVLKLLKKISARPNVIFKPADLNDSQIAAGRRPWMSALPRARTIVPGRSYPSDRTGRESQRGRSLVNMRLAHHRRSRRAPPGVRMRERRLSPYSPTASSKSAE